MGCRPFTALLAAVLFLRPLFECVRQRRWGRLAAVSALPLAAAVALGWYNWARFGSPLEFGRAYLPEFAREGYAQFSLTYLAQNLKNLLRPVTLDAALDLKFPMFDGFLPVAATPLFLVWGAGQVRAIRKKSFDLQDGILLAGLVFTLLGLCTHRTFGGWQFGARYTMDLVPWALLFFSAASPGRTGPRRALAVRGGSAVQFLWGSVPAEPLKKRRGTADWIYCKRCCREWPRHCFYGVQQFACGVYFGPTWKYPRPARRARGSMCGCWQPACAPDFVL